MMLGTYIFSNTKNNSVGALVKINVNNSMKFISKNFPKWESKYLFN